MAGPQGPANGRPEDKLHVPAISVLKAWMPGTSPGMTIMLGRDPALAAGCVFFDFRGDGLADDGESEQLVIELRIVGIARAIGELGGLVEPEVCVHHRGGAAQRAIRQARATNNDAAPARP
jgi:hypothetical protein